MRESRPGFSFEGDPKLQKVVDTFMFHASGQAHVVQEALQKASSAWMKDDTRPTSIVDSAPAGHEPVYKIVDRVLGTGVDKSFQYDGETEETIGQNPSVIRLMQNHGRAVERGDIDEQARLKRQLRIERLSVFLGRLMEPPETLQDHLQ